MKKKSYLVVPAGRYQVKLKTVYDSVSRKQKRPTKTLIFEIESGPNAKRTIIATFMTEIERSMKLLEKVFSYLANGAFFIHPEDLIGKSIGIVLEVKSTGRLGLASMNSITRYFPVE